MTHLSGPERSRYVQTMFAQIARRYDLMNRIMTAGQDVRWRREVVKRAVLPPHAVVLDLGAGTGDLADEIRRQHPTAFPVAADFTLEMMRVGQKRPFSAALHWSAADALQLPFKEHVFDAVVSGFLMRNVNDLFQALSEQRRVLKPGGRIVILDTTRPPQNLLSPAIRLYFKTIIPTLGRLIAGNDEAYTYLPESTQQFLGAETLANRMGEAGFQSVGFERLMFGTIAIHWGSR